MGRGLYYDWFDWVLLSNASMIIGLDEIVGKEYCTRANGSITGTYWERSSDNKTTVWEATMQKQKIYVFPQV